MKNLKENQGQNKAQITVSKIVRSFLVLSILSVASSTFGQTKEVEFDVYTNSPTNASQYLLGDDVAMRDCASVNCEKLTTLNIGTNVRLLAKSETAQTINGITSRFYKIKMGPQVGWIWGGLISQKTMVSQNNPEIKFVFGEAGVDYKGYKRFQIRAVKNGAEIDRIFVKSETLHHDLVHLMQKTDSTAVADVIGICENNSENCDVSTSKTFIVFKGNKLMQTNSLAALEHVRGDASDYVLSCEFDN
ncbi:hypothetical protein [Psychroserpens sp.]|uniref:hypothetical protein n=1 Tax=Psychroserpens sp. TaxID=2020870 RepID=UPI003C746673